MLTTNIVIMRVNEDRCLRVMLYTITECPGANDKHDGGGNPWTAALYAYTPALSSKQICGWCKQICEQQISEIVSLAHDRHAC